MQYYRRCLGLGTFLHCKNLAPALAVVINSPNPRWFFKHTAMHDDDLSLPRPSHSYTQTLRVADVLSCLVVNQIEDRNVGLGAL